MTESIISILNTRLLASNRFNTLYGLSELITIEDKTVPLLYCSNGERKQVSNFDELNGSAYWRKTGDLRVSETFQSSTRSNDKLLQITIPLRLVAVGSRERMAQDNEATPENFAITLFSLLAKNLNGNIRRIIQAQKITVNLNSISDNAAQIISTEFRGTGTTSLGSDLFPIVIEMDCVVEIYESCILTDCDPLTACETLLILLTASQKNECILPTYDFSDPLVFGNLTADQIAALTDELCTASGTVTIKNSDNSFSVSVDCGTIYTLSDQTINVYVDGVLEDTQTVPAMTNPTINIIWT